MDCKTYPQSCNSDQWCDPFMNMCTAFGFSHCRSNSNCVDAGFSTYICVNQQCSPGGNSGGGGAPSGGNSNSGGGAPSGGNSNSGGGQSSGGNSNSGGGQSSGGNPPSGGSSTSNGNSGGKGNPSSTTSNNNSGGSNSSNGSSNSNSGNSNNNGNAIITTTSKPVSNPSPTAIHNNAPAPTSTINSSNNNDGSQSTDTNPTGADTGSDNSGGTNITPFQKALIITIVCGGIVAFLIVFPFVNYQGQIKGLLFGKKSESLTTSPVQISSQGSYASTPIINAPDMQPRYPNSPSLGSSHSLVRNSTNISGSGSPVVSNGSIFLNPPHNGSILVNTSSANSSLAQSNSPSIYANQPVQNAGVSQNDNAQLPIMLHNNYPQIVVDSIPPSLYYPQVYQKPDSQQQ
ncbi:hypothetical protein HDV06_000235 [Boothiomyces sp. JEL0866]|nr:hypothetical protein HDV06_000235 [Boothiomyces sp. JEL0866]